MIFSFARPVTWSLFAFFVLLVFSCGTKRVAKPTTVIPQPSAAETVLRKLDEQRFAADWMDARANIKLDSRDLNAGGTAFIRLERDKKLWVSVKKFGIEAARVLVTPDSFFVINRLSNEYSADPLSYVTDRFGVPADFSLLQALLLGNPVYFDRDLELDENETDRLRLSGDNGRWISDYRLERDSYHLRSMRLRQIDKDQELRIFLDDYQDTELGQPFPAGRTLEIESPKTGPARVELNINRVSFNEAVAMPFVVPRRFRD